MFRLNREFREINRQVSNTELFLSHLSPLSSKPKVFVREATGLVRSFSWVDAFMIASGSVGWGIYAYASQIAFVGSADPGADFFLSEVLGFLAIIPVIYVYAYMSVSMPRSGGDYVWVSRIINGLPGFMIGFAFWIGVYCVGGGGNAFSFGTVGLPDTLVVMSYALHNPSLVSLTTALSQPMPAFILGIGVLVVGALIGGSSAKVFHRSMLVLTALIILGAIVSFIILGTASHADFVNAVNGYGGTNMTYDGIINQAKATGWSWSGTTWGMTLASVPLGFLLFASPSNASLASGEVKNVRTSMPLAMFICLVVALIVDGVGTLLTVNVVGYPFIQASLALGSSWPLVAPPWAIVFISMLTNNLALLAIVQLGWLAFFFWAIGQGFLTATRYVFAFSFDRTFPTMFADISERFHFPIKAMLLSFAVQIIFLIFTAFTTLVGAFLNLTTIMAIVWAVGSLAAVLLPFRKKELAQPLPGSKWKIPLISIMGAISFIINCGIVYFASTTQLVGPSTPASAAALILIFVAGGVIFALRTYQLKRQGFSLKAVYSEIPPE